MFVNINSRIARRYRSLRDRMHAIPCMHIYSQVHQLLHTKATYKRERAQLSGINVTAKGDTIAWWTFYICKG